MTRARDNTAERLRFSGNTALFNISGIFQNASNTNERYLVETSVGESIQRLKYEEISILNEPISKAFFFGHLLRFAETR